MRSKVIGGKNVKICITVKQLYLSICKHISFQAKLCMLIVISLKTLRKCFFFITKCSYVSFKMGSKVIKCNSRSIFTNCVSFFLWSKNKMFLKVSNGAKIRNRYNQAPHLTQDTNGKVTNSQKTPQTRAKRSALSQQVTTKHI